MLHPSYSDLMQVVNKDSGEDKPVVRSRYSIVMAASKRARQLIAGTEPKDWEHGLKPLSVAVDEISKSDVKILGTASDETETAGDGNID